MTQLYNLAEGLPQPKRLKTKLTQNYDAFQPGSIVRCKLTNFMSYALTEFHFGPKMNLIIGPNGSGKSTFVCAVCIGLGGKLANLGKESMSTDGFIKDSQTHSIIELELKAFPDYPTATITITTHLLKGSKTQWEINGRTATENEIKKILKAYNIQLDNLCQFLPQDRVSKFADLKSEDLLREIERSYGNGQLLEDHNAITALQSTIAVNTKKFDESNNLLEELKTKNDSLRESVEKHKHFLKLQRDLEKTEMIRPYVVYQEKKRQRDHVKQAYESKKEDYKLFQAKIRPLKDAISHGDEKVRELEDKIEDLENQKSKFKLNLKRTNDELVKLDNKNKKYLQQLMEYDSTMDQAKRNYRKHKQEVERTKQVLSELDTVDQEELQEWKESRNTLNQKINSIEGIISEKKSRVFAYENQLKQVDSHISNQKSRLNSTDRLNQLDSNRYKVTLQAINYLRNNNTQFEYSEPALVTLNVNDKAAAPIVEALVPYSQMNSVVVPTRNDYNEISRFLYDERKCMVSIRTLGASFNMENDRISRADIVKLGFDGFITDFISGPSDVIQMLCENVYLHRIPVSIKGLSSDQKDRISQEIERGLNLVKYVSYDEIYTMNRSNFGRRQVTTNIKSFRLKSHIFVNGLSEDQKRQIHERVETLKNEHANIEKSRAEALESMTEGKQEYQEMKVQYHSLEQNIIRAASLKKERAKLEGHIKLAIDRMESKKKELKALKHSSSSGSRNKIFSKIEEVLNEKLNLEGVEKRKLVIKCIELDNLLLKLNIEKVEEVNMIAAVNSLNESIQTELKEKQEELIELKRKFKEFDVIYKKAIESYKDEKAKYTQEELHDIANIIKDMAEKNILTHEGLDGKLDQIRSEIQLNNRSGGENSLRKLEENEEKIKELSKEIPIIEQTITRDRETLESMFEKWEAELDKIIGIISDDFGKNMSIIASAGNVVLDKSDSDYSKWKLIIQVSFRDNEGLSNFNGAQHSGGEKSTTTAVFLNSLQGLTNTPFRVVDEINQGMDAKNERKAHELIVKRATDTSITGTSQYFLITPKLLGDLYYGPDMAVHCIFAGRFHLTPEMVKSEDVFLQMGICERYVE